MSNLFIYGLIYSIPLLPAFVKGTVSPTTYNIVNKEKEFHGGVKLGLTFTPEPGFEPGVIKSSYAPSLDFLLICFQFVSELIFLI